MKAQQRKYFVVYGCCFLRNSIGCRGSLIKSVQFLSKGGVWSCVKIFCMKSLWQMGEGCLKILFLWTNPSGTTIDLIISEAYIVKSLTKFLLIKEQRNLLWYSEVDVTKNISIKINNDPQCIQKINIVQRIPQTRLLIALNKNKGQWGQTFPLNNIWIHNKGLDQTCIKL